MDATLADTGIIVCGMPLGMSDFVYDMYRHCERTIEMLMIPFTLLITIQTQWAVLLNSL